MASETLVACIESGERTFALKRTFASIESSTRDVNVNVITMDFDGLLDKCVALENTIFSVIKNNARKQTELSCLQSDILKNVQSESEALADYEHELKDQLENLKTKIEELETELKIYNDINEKLDEIVVTAKRTAKEKRDFSYSFKEESEEYEQIQKEHIDMLNELAILKEADTQQFRQYLNDSRQLVIALYKNDQILKVLERQNKFAEQQFDFILNELPWEPLSHNYFEDLRNSKDESIRCIADVLRLQTAEINDLNESLNSKKGRKLEILEQLARQLDMFVRKRETALLTDQQKA